MHQINQAECLERDLLGLRRWQFIGSPIVSERAVPSGSYNSKATMTTTSRKTSI